MKRLTTILVVLVMALFTGTTAYADTGSVQITTEDGLIASAPEASPLSDLRPFDVEYSTLNGVPIIIKRYELPPETEHSVFPLQLTQGGVTYHIVEVLQKEQPPTIESKTIHETVTLDTATDKQADILSLLPASRDYAADGYSGQLFLDPAALHTTVSETKAYSYATTAQREYTGLDRADLAYIPKTIQNAYGQIMQLADVDWTPYEASRFNNGKLPTSFTAIASYSGTASGSKASAYTTTATYSGEVQKSTPGAMIFSTIYEGEPAVSGNTMPSEAYILSGFSLGVLIVLALVFLYNILVKRSLARVRRRYHDQ